MGNEESVCTPAQSLAKQGKVTAIVTLKKYLDHPTGKGLEASAVQEGRGTKLFPSSSLAYWLQNLLCRQAFIQILALQLPCCGNLSKLLNFSKPWCLYGNNHPVNFPHSYCKDYASVDLKVLQHRVYHSVKYTGNGSCHIIFVLQMQQPATT